MTPVPTVRIDESAAPSLVLHFDGALTADDVLAYTAAYERSLATNARFGVIMVTSEAYFAAPPDTALANMVARWLKAHKAGLASRCAGIATVIADEPRRAALASPMEERGEEIYGCPVRVFADIAAARDWLAR